MWTGECERTVNGLTALHFAVKSGHEDCVRFLLDHGADPERTDASGKTAFLYIARYRHANLFLILATVFNVDIAVRSRFGENSLQLAARSVTWKSPTS